MLTLLILVPTTLAGVFLVSFSVGLLSSSHTTREKDASDTWRAIVHRNAISEPIPFASSVARVNAPGLVQVYSQRNQQMNLPICPQHPEPEPTPTAPIQPALPAPVSIKGPVDASVSAISAARKLPMELADEPNDEERDIVMRLWERGRAMTAIILSVWGIKSGGSARYAAARARYQYYISEARKS